MAGRGSGDHLGGSQQKPVDPGGGGDSMLAASAKRLRQEMFGRLRPHPLPPSTSPVALPSRPLLSKVPSVAPLVSNTGLNQLGGRRPPGAELKELARKVK